MQKMTLRFVVIGLLYHASAVIEGTLMRAYEVASLPFVGQQQFFAILTAHPLVGIFGSTYSIVCGAFLFLVPYLMKRPLWSIKLTSWTCGLLAGGTLVFWLAGFLTHYAPLYTLYWPLPADFAQFSVVGGTFFIVGIALAMVGTASFVVNIYATITYTPAGWEKQPAGAFLADALGITAVRNFFARRKTEHLVSLPVAAIARGTVDTAFNAAVILFTGVLILVYMVAALMGIDLRRSAIDALLYKNWIWWGLDLVADGLVLIFVAGTWYLRDAHHGQEALHGERGAGGAPRVWSEKLTSLHFWGQLPGGIGMGAFMIVTSVGLKGVVGIFLPASSDTKDLVPAAS
jgi:cytochrome c oxidase subunit 1